MLSWLSDIWSAIKDLPYLIVGLLVELLNAFILAIAALAQLLLDLLPSFPDAPSTPGGVMGLLLWVVPLGPIASIFSLLVACWVAFLAVKVGLRWVKAL